MSFSKRKKAFGKENKKQRDREIKRKSMTAFLDLDQLYTFIAIAETGGFTQASHRVYKTQSAVSMQMKRLEECVGQTLFIREGRQSRLSDDGEHLLTYARRMLRLNEETLSGFRDNDLHGHVRLGTPDDYADRFLPEILKRFSCSHPYAEVTVICAPTKVLVEHMRKNEIDVAILSNAHAVGQEAPKTIRIEPLLWVTSARHAVHEEHPVPLALGRSTCDWRSAAIRTLERVSRDYRVLYSSWNSTAVGAVVAAGLAVSVLPESTIRPGMRILQEVDGFPPLPICKISLIRGGQHTMVVIDAFIEHVIASLDNISIKSII